MNNKVKNDDRWIGSTCVHNADLVRNDCELGSKNKENIQGYKSEGHLR